MTTKKENLGFAEKIQQRALVRQTVKFWQNQDFREFLKEGVVTVSEAVAVHGEVVAELQQEWKQKEKGCNKLLSEYVDMIKKLQDRKTEFKQKLQQLYNNRPKLATTSTRKYLYEPYEVWFKKFEELLKW